MSGEDVTISVLEDCIRCGFGGILSNGERCDTIYALAHVVPCFTYVAFDLQVVGGFRFPLHPSFSYSQRTFVKQGARLNPRGIHESPLTVCTLQYTSKMTSVLRLVTAQRSGIARARACHSVFPSELPRGRRLS